MKFKVGDHIVKNGTTIEEYVISIDNSLIDNTIYVTRNRWTNIDQSSHTEYVDGNYSLSKKQKRNNTLEQLLNG